jgi:hypothetical protein
MKNYASASLEYLLLFSKAMSLLPGPLNLSLVPESDLREAAVSNIGGSGRWPSLVAVDLWVLLKSNYQ